MLNFVIGNVTNPLGSGPRIVAHITSDAGRLGKGVAFALNRRWPAVRKSYIAWAGGIAGGPPLALGNVQLVRVADSLWVANMVAQAGFRSEKDMSPHIRYDALGECLAKLAQRALLKSASVHMPRIGTALAGGEWSVIRPLIQLNLVDRGVDVTVYTLKGEAHSFPETAAMAQTLFPK